MYADVGVGISPSKIVLTLEGGKAQELDLLAFNSGDDLLEVSLTADGEIAPFTTIDLQKVIMEPEPKPHKLPIKNGKPFKVIIRPPSKSVITKYTGVIAVTGSPTGDSQFGGSVSVAAQIELTVTPPKSFLSYITTTHLLIAGIIVLIIIAVFLLKKAGLKFSFDKKQPTQQQQPQQSPPPK